MAWQPAAESSHCRPWKVAQTLARHLADVNCPLMLLRVGEHAGFVQAARPGPLSLSACHGDPWCVASGVAVASKPTRGVLWAAVISSCIHPG